ncbi:MULTISPECIES: CDP-alcohol phosphatidyltransferase family protein [unclassified Paraburkholderia]|uniref:CDP-alcohol phosphatidyltransferase family protein n=1 Tax=unclassified Paraburkholderia TaxID=2615204 RepID=UPI00197DE755|nr:MULTISPECIES: CDP-alcohol phosphatidyltransferase family protein [unclassified Paraburkholderia]MBN3854146.1 CDP-alcohol phosphatidyltransferase family protein [Paraburkholderia sp. Ac-20340]
MTGKDQPVNPAPRVVPLPRTWDARAARWLVTPLVSTRVTPNHLTTLRLLIGVAGAFYLARGDFLHVNIGAFLIVLSNFVDHTDGELARISGKTSRIGHFYDLAADAATTILLFFGMGYGLGVASAGTAAAEWHVPPAVLGGIAGVAVAVIFFLRMRIEEMAGKSGTQQAFVGGFETEDVLYLLPLVTLTGIASPFVLAASIGAPLFAAYVVLDYWRVTRRAAGKETSQVWISR